ncbi:hypothetical protein HH214_05120 [Mucilaginibacter robiniae]|uniref:Uncharacterized protein n=1 Tax=Mucilaginibacter robiniae TaxID=2728022 RepID=A0A7L5E4P1_9SPHI|nr:hypothetical protein [Mucilaginibacter robiniae]QJD95296.1 hypothetical protein HH214_05120 [Mucilaginibacter robiniae]
MAAEQAFVIKFNFNTQDFDLLDELEDSLETTTGYHNLGVYDGYELNEDGTRGEFYITTADAELLYKNLKPILLDSRILQGSKVELQQLADDGSVQILKEYTL